MANESEKPIVYLTIKQCAEKVPCHPNTIRNWLNDKSLPAVRYGRNMIRIDEKDLEKKATQYRGGEFGVWSQM